jgi:ribose-phosphate pyrophosphokinase
LTIAPGKRMMLFAGRSSTALGAAIGRRLGVVPGDARLQTFPGGEVHCNFDESLRGAEVFLVQSLTGSRDGALTPNDALMELLLMVDAARGASAHRVVAVTPWFGYARQDRKAGPREPISARVVARTLQAVGIDRLVSMDLHTGQAQGFFATPVDHMTGLHLLADHLAPRVGQGAVVAAPDAGQVKLAKLLASRLDADLAILDPDATDPAQALIGEVAGRTVVIADDIVDTGRTLTSATATLRAAGAGRLYAAATHGLLASAEGLERVSALGLEEVLVTDTVAPPPDAPPWLTVVGVAGLLAATIRSIVSEGSVSSVFNGDN